MEKGRDRAYQDAPAQRGQGRKGCQALGNDGLVGGKAVVGERFPVWEVKHLRVRGLAQEESEFALQPVGAFRVGGDHEHRRILSSGGSGQGEGVGPGQQAAPAQAALRAVGTRGREGIGAVTHGGLTYSGPPSVHPAGWPRGGEVLIMPAFLVSASSPGG